MTVELKLGNLDCRIDSHRLKASLLIYCVPNDPHKFLVTIELEIDEDICS